MSRVYGLLYDEGYEELTNDAILCGTSMENHYAAELGEAIRRKLGFDSIRFWGITDDAEYGYEATGLDGNWQVVAYFEPEIERAHVRYVRLTPGTQVVGETTVFL